MFDMKHSDTTPTSYDLFVYPVSRSYDEGTGIEMNGIDIGYSNWISASSVQAWTNQGADFITSSYGSGSQHFDSGVENFEVEVTSIVNAWLTGGLQNNGLLVKLGNTEETNSIDYYIKQFHGRQSKFIEFLPYLEARWSNITKDNRSNFLFNQNNNLYLYNFVRNQLSNLTEPITVKIQDNLGTVGYSASFSASFVETGVYSSSVNFSNTASSSSIFYDIWYSGSTVYSTGTFNVVNVSGSTSSPNYDFTLSVNNLQQIYSTSDEVRFTVNARKKNFKNHIGVIKSASLNMDREYLENLYYSIENNENGQVVVPFGTGSSNPYTQCGYDGEGNYFHLYMNSFVPGFVYRIKFLIQFNKIKKMIDQDFVFKVV